MTIAVRVSNPATARDRADRIREGLEELKPLILAAWEARDWEALGYASWQEYVVGEFGGQLRLGRAERQEAVKELREAGMSTRAIGAALGVSQPTVMNDIAGEQNLSPAPITGLDGKTYQPLRLVGREHGVVAVSVGREDGVVAPQHQPTLLQVAA